jgi:hypothetical protein
MVAMTGASSPQLGDSGSIALDSFNIRSGRNGGMEGALRAMDQLGDDIHFLLETKLTDSVYTQFLSGYEVITSTAPLARQGGIALFWRSNNLYEIKETRIWGPNVISLHLMMGAVRFYVVGCYIPPSDLETLTYIIKAWSTCPTGAHPILAGDLNINLRAPRTEQEETIAEQMDSMNLFNMSRHFCQCSGKRLRGRWMWRMRREKKWISSGMVHAWVGQKLLKCDKIRSFLW